MFTFLPDNTLGCYSYRCTASGSHCRTHCQVHRLSKPVPSGVLPSSLPRLLCQVLPGDTSLLQTATRSAQALRELETLHKMHSKSRGLREGLAVFKQPGFGNFGSQQKDSLLTWAVDRGTFQARLFDFRLFSSKTIFSDGWGGPTQGFLSGPSATLRLYVIWKSAAIAYLKEDLPTYSHRLPFLLQSH